MGKKVYSQELNEALLVNFFKLKDIYQNNKSGLSIEILESKIDELLDNFEEIDQIEFDSYRSAFKKHFENTNLDVSFGIDSQIFKNEFVKNENSVFVYIYFISNFGSNVNLGFRFSDESDLKDDLLNHFDGEAFYVLDGNTLKSETQANFANFVNNFHNNYDELLHDKGIDKTKYTKDSMTNAMKFINSNPQDFEIFLTVKSDKLSTSIVAADLVGTVKYYNRGVQWP